MQSNRFLRSIGNGCNLHDGPTDMPHLFLRRKVESTVPELSCPCENTHCYKEMKFKYENLSNKFDSKFSHGHWAHWAHTNRACNSGHLWVAGRMDTSEKQTVEAAQGTTHCTGRLQVLQFHKHGQHGEAGVFTYGSFLSSSEFLHLSFWPSAIVGSIDALLIVVSVAEVVDGVVAALLVPCGCRCCHAWGHSHHNCASCYWLLSIRCSKCAYSCHLMLHHVALYEYYYRCLCHFVLVAGSGRVGGGWAATTPNSGKAQKSRHAMQSTAVIQDVGLDVVCVKYMMQLQLER